MKDEILQIIEDTQDEFLGMNEANLHSAERIERLFIDFVKWYSGMEEEKILKALERFKKEKL